MDNFSKYEDKCDPASIYTNHKAVKCNRKVEGLKQTWGALCHPLVELT